MITVPSNDNTISYATTTQPCTNIGGGGGGGGGGGRGIPDIILPPVPPPKIGGPPGEIIVGPDIGGPVGDCRCFMHSPSEFIQVNNPLEGPGCFKRSYTWKQTCEPTNITGQYKGLPGLKGSDPFGGKTEFNQTIRITQPCGRGFKRVKFGIKGNPYSRNSCADPLTGKCGGNCEDIVYWYTCCPEIGPPDINMMDVTPTRIVEVEGDGRVPPVQVDDPSIFPGDVTEINGERVRTVNPEPGGGSTFTKITIDSIIVPPVIVDGFIFIFISRMPIFRAGGGDPGPIHNNDVIKIKLPGTVSVDDYLKSGDIIKIRVPRRDIINKDPTRVNSFKLDPNESKGIGIILGKSDRRISRPIDTPYGQPRSPDLSEISPIDINYGEPGGPDISDPYTTSKYIVRLDEDEPKVVGNSPFNNDYVFQPILDNNVAIKATITETKFTAADPNNIFKEININRVLNTLLTPLGGSNPSLYNDKTISIFLNISRDLIRDNLSEDIVKALTLIDQKNINSYNLRRTLMDTFFRAVVNGKLELYSYGNLSKMHSAATYSEVDTSPPLLSQPELNAANALSYLSNNLYSLLPQMYPSDTSEGRLVMHTYYLPTEIGEVVPITTEAGVDVPVAVGINSSFPVYQADGSEVEVPTFLGFCDITDSVGSNKTVILKSNRASFYSVNPSTKSLALSLLDNGPQGLCDIDRMETHHTVSAAYTEAIANERNAASTVLKKGYFVKINKNTLEELHSDQVMIKKYQADYDLVWTTDDTDSEFNDIEDLSKVSGPYTRVYVPAEDPWWSWFLSSEKVTVMLPSLAPGAYVPENQETIISSEMPFGIMYIPTKNVFDFDPLLGGSVLNYFTTEATTTTPSTRKIISTVNPAGAGSNHTVGSLKKSNEINLQGQPDLGAIKFTKNFTNSDLSVEAVLDDVEVSTTTSIQGQYLNRIFDLKSKYDLAYDGGFKLTQFDLYKGFTVNELTQIVGELKSSLVSNEIKKMTDVDIILNRKDNLDLPTSFITTPIVEGDEDTTDYLGTKYHTIKYFPDEDNIYNKIWSNE